MLTALTFHTKDPDGFEDTINRFLFPDLSPLAGLEAAFLTRKWDAILGGGNLNSFKDTSLLMGKQKVAPIAGWEGSQVLAPQDRVPLPREEGRLRPRQGREVRKQEYV